MYNNTKRNRPKNTKDSKQHLTRRSSARPSQLKELKDISLQHNRSSARSYDQKDIQLQPLTKSPNRHLHQYDSMDAIIDISIIKCSQQRGDNQNQHQNQNENSHSPGFKDYIPENQNSSCSEPMFANSSQDFDEDRNYSILHKQYQRLIHRESQNSESQSRILNVSTGYAAQSGGSLQKQQKNQQRKESVIRKFEQIIKMLNRFVDKPETREPSINISRHSEAKRFLNSNLFEINEEWDSEILNKEESKVGKAGSQIMEFTLKEINRNWLEEEGEGKREAALQETEKRKTQAANTIKSFWGLYRKHQNKFWHYRKLMLEKQEQKVQDYFPTPVPDATHNNKPQDNLNQLLSQLQKDSNHDKDDSINSDHQSPETAPQQAHHHHQIATDISLQDRKKIHGDLVANIQSLSAIQPNEQFRHMSENEEEEKGAMSLEEILERRENWIEEVKNERGAAWRHREMQLLAKMRAIARNPTVWFQEGWEDKGVGTGQ